MGAKSKTRVPVVTAEFNQYINETDAFIQDVVDPGPPVVTNGIRLGLSAQNIADWSTKRVFWRDTLYPKWSNPNTKTTSVNVQVQDFMRGFRTFANPLLNKKISVSDAATQDDAELFNFKLTRKAPSRLSTAITEQCFASIKPLGGGMLRLSCRIQQDTKRASLPEQADAIQVAVKIGEPPPAGHKDGTEVILLTKATGTHDLGADNAGKTGYAFFRWYNTRYPQFAGPWSVRVSFVIA